MIILASSSERRVALLKQIGIDFEIICPDIDESLPEGILPQDAVAMLSRKKAVSVCDSIDNNLTIIAADTVVFASGKILGKPLDENDAFLILSMLSGKKHSVYTGLTVIKKTGRDVFPETVVDCTDVFMREISEKEIWDYIKTGEPMDKAGAYAIQGRGAVFVERVEGDFFTVVGLPLVKLYKLLLHTVVR